MYPPIARARARIAVSVRYGDPENEARGRAELRYAKAEYHIVQALETLGNPTPEQRSALAAFLLAGGASR